MALVVGTVGGRATGGGTPYTGAGGCAYIGAATGVRARVERPVAGLASVAEAGGGIVSGGGSRRRCAGSGGDGGAGLRIVGMGGDAARCEVYE